MAPMSGQDGWDARRADYEYRIGVQRHVRKNWVWPAGWSELTCLGEYQPVGPFEPEGEHWAWRYRSA